MRKMAYVCTKSLPLFKLWSSIALCLSGIYQYNVCATSTESNEECHAIYRTGMAYTESE